MSGKTRVKSKQIKRNTLAKKKKGIRSKFNDLNNKIIVI